MARAHVKRNDVVVVISGDHQGKAGKVLSVDHEKQRVIVEGINMRKSAVRRTQNKPEGGIVEKEAPLHLSNVMLQEKYDSRRAAGQAAEAQK